MFYHRLHAVPAQIFDKENFACPSWHLWECQRLILLGLEIEVYDCANSYIKISNSKYLRIAIKR